MSSSIADRRITEVLADPIVTLMMRADGVDRRTLADELRAIAQRLVADDEEESADEAPGWLAGLTHLKSAVAGVCCR